ncbi:hypothetical protein [Dactylosporangium darangshiense]|uniref:hypothetical protein n=1 Tax=Dactylosporangium darangshiense TaxID=579108 RepID=UPI0031E7038C
MRYRWFLVQAALTRLAYRIIGFGDVEPFFGASAQDAPMWAEIAADQRLRRIAAR